MEVADGSASGAFGTYDQWLQVQKTSVLSYYTEFLNKSGCEKGSRNPERMAENIENHLEENVTFTIDELEKLMRRYQDDDLIFSMLITSIIDKLEGVATLSSNKIYIPEKLRIHIFYLCHIRLLEHFNAKKKEGKKMLQKALDQMRSTLYQKTRNDYEHAKSGDIKWLMHGVAHSTASKCHVNPYVI